MLALTLDLEILLLMVRFYSWLSRRLLYVAAYGMVGLLANVGTYVPVARLKYAPSTSSDACVRQWGNGRRGGLDAALAWAAVLPS